MLFLLGLIYLLLPGMSEKQNENRNTNSIKTDYEILPASSLPDSIPETKIDSIIDLGKTFLGKPYGYQGPSPWPMDCSGYVSYIFGEYGIVIPHISRDIGLIVKTVEISDIKKGDFMFFKGSNLNDTVIGHVSLVIEVSNNQILIMHNTNSRGIIIEDYNISSYFKERFIKVGRVR
ncbi:MAG: C40 family peptidase [Cyclobacteriaceae bacterium]|nr:C40 family peptidase [Cyclobacteriaceae bacterium]